MSGASVGGLEMQMLLDMAKWQNDVTNVGRVLDKGMTDMKRMATSALGGLMAGLSVAAFSAWIKNAIDAGDEAHNMAQKMGVATKDVAGIQLAFKQAGVDGDAMQKAMVSLSVKVAAGDEVFKRMGVSVRNADGSLKSSKQVLYDVADAYQKMPDGINKTSLATDVFDKRIGANLIPMLRLGSEGLQQMADMAEKLGLVIDENTGKAADEFNDTLELVGMASQGVARKVTAELLPTLNSVAGAFLKSMTEGESLARGADILGFAFKGVVTIGLLTAEVVNALGMHLGGLAATIAAFVDGGWSQASAAWQAHNEDIKRSNVQTQKTVSDLWTGEGAKVVEQAKAVSNAVGGATVATKEQADAAKKAAAEQEKLTKAGQDYLTQLNAEYGAVMQSISLGRELTEGEKALLKMEEQLAAGKMTLTAAERASAEAKIAEIAQIKEQRKQQEEYLKLLAAVAVHASKWNDDQIKTTEALRAGNVQLIEQNDKLRMGEAAWAARERTVLLNQAADLEWQAANQGGNFQLEEQARLLRERAALMGDGTALKEAKAVSDEWAKTVESIQNGLTDALMRAFESGKGFMDAFKDTVLNAFRTLILKPMVQQMVAQLAGGMQGAIGWLGSAMGATGGGGGAQQLSGPGAGGAVAGAGSLTSIPYLGWAVLGAMKANSDYGEGFNSSGARQLANDTGLFGRGGLGSYEADQANLWRKLGVGDKLANLLSGATAISKIFGRASAQATGAGISGNFGMGDFSGSSFLDWKAKGGLFRSDKTGTSLGALDADMGAALSSAAGGILAHVGEYAAALALPVTALASVTTHARIDLGADAAANQKAIDEALAGYGAALVAGYQQALAAAGQPGESTIDTLNRLGQSILAVNTTFEALGLNLVQTSVAGGAAAANIISLTGGLDAFLAKTQSYLGNYFSEAEQMGITAGGVLNTLYAAGLDFKGATSRGDLRALMETMNPNNAMDQGHIAALLNVSSDFAKVADYLQTSGLTLAQLAGQAPAGYDTFVGPRAPSDPAGTTQALQVQANTSLGTIATATTDSVSVLRAVVDALVLGNQRLSAQISDLLDAVNTGSRRTSDAILEVGMPP